MDGWKKKEEGSGERKGGETQIRARAMMWQQTKPPPPRRGRRGRNGQRGRDRWDERGESGVNGWDTNRAKDIAAHGQSRGTEGLEWTSRPGRELSYGAGGWMPFSASCKMDKAGKLPRIFSDYSIYSGIKGEAWYRLSESAEIDWALTTKRLFVRRGQGVADRWPPAQSGIKARSSRVQGHGSAAHQQGRRPRHNNVPQAFFFFYPLSFCLRDGFDLLNIASFTLRRRPPVRDRMNGRTLKRRKRTNLYSHMSGDTPHPNWRTISVSVYYPMSNSRHEGLLLIRSGDVLCSVLISAHL